MEGFKQLLNIAFSNIVTRLGTNQGLQVKP